MSSLDRGTKTEHSLMVNKKIYRIHGVAGSCEELDILQKWGANTLRTYEPINLQNILDNAVAHGLKVMVGLNVRYQKPETLDKALETVKTFKSHPGVLLWCLGNELEMHCTDFEGIFKLLEDAACRVKAIDASHVVAHMFMDFGSNPKNPIIPYMKALKNVDVLGFNTYLGAPSLAARYKSTIRKDKPFVVGEFGWMPAMLGRRVPWGIIDDRSSPAHEKSSTDKAMHFAASIQSFHASELCIGSFAFRWGLGSPKAVVGGYTMPSETWHCCCLDGCRTGIADVLIEAWTGAAVKYPCPVITSLVEYYYKGSKSHLKENTWTGISLAPENCEVNAGESFTVQCKAEGGTGTLNYVWEIRHHNTIHKEWPSIRRGAPQETKYWTEWSKNAPKIGTKYTTTNPRISFIAPPKGVYRLHVTVTDDKQGCAYASYPFRST